MQEYQKIEEVFEDKDCEIFDTILSINLIDLLKNKLRVVKDQGIDVHGVFPSHFSGVCRLVHLQLFIF